MKKIFFAFFILGTLPFFVYAKDVSSFIGLYTGYTQNTMEINEYDDWNYSYEYKDFTFKNLMFGFSSRFGISDEITPELTLYYLGLLELGLYLDIGEKTTYGRYYGEVNFGAEIKCIYNKYSFGLAFGTITPQYYILFARPSMGYNILNDTILELFFDYQVPYNFERPFSGYKTGLSISFFK